MNNIHIPPEAVEAAAKTIASDDGWPLGWEDYIDTATAAIRAALEAWPGVGSAAIPHWPGPHQEIEQRPSIILPLTEPRDERD